MSLSLIEAIFVSIAICILVCGIIVAVLVVYCPKNVIEFGIAFQRKRHRFQEKKLDNWCYLEKNPTGSETIVCLHGFSASKDSLVPLASHFPSKYRIILPDLPSHGDTLIKSETMQDMVEHISVFISQLGVPVHLAGCSMGGLATALLAAEFPHLVSSVTLICPAGISMPVKSKALDTYENCGQNVFRIHQPEHMETLLPLLFHRPPRIPPSILNWIAMDKITRRHELDLLMCDLIENPTVLDERLPSIRVEVLVLWGKHDQVFDVSCIQVIKAALEPKIRVMENCGHCVQREAPKSCAREIIQFIRDIS